MLRAIFSLRTLLFVVYGLALTAVLLYVRFPAEKFRLYCESYLERVVPDTTCSIGRIHYRFPATVTFEGVSLAWTVEESRAVVLIDRFAVSPGGGKFFREFNITGTLYSGVWSARVKIDRASREFLLEDIQLDGLDAALLFESLKNLERKVAGLVHFAGSYQASFDKPYGGTGQGKVAAENGSFALLQPVLSLAAIDFQQLAVDVRYDEKRIGFQDGKVQGEDLTADFSGELAMGKSLGRSDLQLNGQLALQAGYLSNHPREQRIVQGLQTRYKRPAIPFKVGGTMIRPTFRFGM